MKIRILPPTIVLAAIVLMLGLHFFLPVMAVISWPWRLCGIVPLGFGVVFNLWADDLFKKANTTVKPFEKSSSLIVAGPFRATRHPMYVGMTGILIGLWVLLGTLTSAAAIPLFVIVLSVFFIPAEEAMMVKQFGQEYREYKKKVRRWL